MILPKRFPYCKNKKKNNITQTFNSHIHTYTVTDKKNYKDFRERFQHFQQRQYRHMIYQMKS